jgi:two-component system chemotaxis response regulator CheB
MPAVAPAELRVLVVDDSAVVRQVMQSILSTDRRLTVTVAADPVIALRKLELQLPHVIVTDLEMPRMDGLAFIREIMSRHPLPIVVCSAMAERGARLAMRALEEGAVDVITKPKVGVREFLHESAVLLLDSVWSAAQAKVPQHGGAPAPIRPQPIAIRPASIGRGTVIAIGASTGGPEALSTFLASMPKDCPPIVVVQHMPQVFTRAFAERLNRDCLIAVKEAEEGDALEHGRALIAPGNFHMKVVRSGRGLWVAIESGPLVSRHRPSVDVLFHSVARSVGANAVGVIMTGMGDDGADGMAAMKDAGATTLAQDEGSCIVFGMPREAILRGCVDRVLALEHLAARALER